MSTASTTFEQEFLAIPKPALIFSVVLHLCAPFFLIGMQYMADHNMLPFLSKKRIDTKEIYQTFIQVDVVALPDNLIMDRHSLDTSLPTVDNPQTATEEIKAQPKTEEAPKVEENVMEETKDGETKNQEMKTAEAAKKAKEESEKVEKAEKAAKEKQRVSEQEKALKRLHDDAAREAALKSIANKPGARGRGKLAGNKLSKGTSMTGNIGQEKEQFNAILLQKIRDKFNVPPWMKNKKLSADLEIKLYPNGRIRSKKIVKPSANPNYDSAILLAVELAEPFPPPSDPMVVAEPFNITLTPE